MTDEEVDRICDEALRAWLNKPTCGENFVCPIFLAFGNGEISEDSYQRHGARKMAKWNRQLRELALLAREALMNELTEPK